MVADIDQVEQSRLQIAEPVTFQCFVYGSTELQLCRGPHSCTSQRNLPSEAVELHLYTCTGQIPRHITQPEGSDAVGLDILNGAYL